MANKAEITTPLPPKKSQKRRVSIKTRVMSIVFMALAFVLLAALIIIIIFPSSPANVFGVRMFFASNTRSMQPDIQFRDLIVVRERDFSEVAVGDIVTFRSAVLINGRADYIFITHKVIDEHIAADGTRFLQTSGIYEGIAPDVRPLTVDGRADTNEYVGTLVFSSRFLGLLLAYLGSPLGITMLILNIGALIAMFWIIKPGQSRRSLAAKSVTVGAAISGDKASLTETPDIIDKSISQQMGMSGIPFNKTVFASDPKNAETIHTVEEFFSELPNGIWGKVDKK